MTWRIAVIISRLFKTVQYNSRSLWKLTSVNSQFKMSSFNPTCCTKPCIKSDYQPIGTEHQLQDLIVYQTGNPQSKHLLICAYDIFGFHPNTKQFADQLAQAGNYYIVMPDFFKGSPWDSTNFPPKDFQDVIKWIGDFGSWSIVEPELQKVIQHYKSIANVESIGIFGFCWGAKMAMKAGAKLEGIDGIALIHGSMLDDNDALLVQCPVIFIPAKNDINMIPFYKKVQERLGEDKSEHYRIEDMDHGFAAARGDFTDPLNQQRVEEVIALISTFFKKHFNVIPT